MSLRERGWSLSQGCKPRCRISVDKDKGAGPVLLFTFVVFFFLSPGNMEIAGVLSPLTVYTPAARVILRRWAFSLLTQSRQQHQLISMRS